MLDLFKVAAAIVRTLIEVVRLAREIYKDHKQQESNHHSLPED